MAAQASQAALAGKCPEVGERAVVPVCEDLLDDGVVAVLASWIVSKDESVKTAW